MRIEIESGLDALQRAVGGYIEAVYPYEDPVALIVNEEGKLNGLPLNRSKNFFGARRTEPEMAPA